MKNIYKNKIDGFAETLKENHLDFYNQYKVVRDVLNYGASHTKPDEENQTPPPPDGTKPPAQ